MLTDLWGETVINPSGDMPNAAFGADDINKPRVYYMENVMPTSAGYQSIDWRVTTDAAAGMTSLRYFKDILQLNIPNPFFGTLDDPEFITIYVATPYGAPGGLWVADNTLGTGNWVFVSIPFLATILPIQLTTAFVQGQTYLFIAGKGCFHYDATTHAFVLDALIGVTPANITGITSANGYMIVYGANSVLWSSLVNPLDFTPSLVTGAGGGQVGELKSQLIGCFGISGGFICYTYDNTVQASYTGNVQFPFKFQEVPGGGGIQGNDSVSWQDNNDTHIVYGTKGLQTVSIGSDATQIFPEVTEMLGAGYTEIFNRTTLQFERTNQDFLLVFELNPLINLIGTRYIVISYNPVIVTLAGQPYLNYSHALVYDKTLGRWGKLVKDHVDVIEFEELDFTGPNVTPPRNSIAFVEFDGTMSQIVMEFTTPDVPTGVVAILMLGKFQLQRNRGVYLQRVKFENFLSEQQFDSSVYAYPTYDGKTFATPVKLTNLKSADEQSGEFVQTFGGRIYGKNVSVLLMGQFNLSSAQVDLVIGADD